MHFSRSLSKVKDTVSEKMMNLFIFKMLIPDNIFEIKSMKFAMGMLLSGLFYTIAVLFIVSVCTAFVIDEGNVVENALEGLFLNLEHT